MSALFNPYSLLAVRIPLGMLTYPKLSWGAKCLYGRLALHRGLKADGYCNPGLETLAAEMGTSVDAVSRWMGELVHQRFIERRRRGPRRTAECIFLEHPVFRDSGKLRNQEHTADSAITPNQDSGLIPHYWGSDSAKIQDADSAELQSPHKEEKVQSENMKENASSSESAVVVMAPEATDDEPFHNSHGDPKPEDLDALVSTAQDQLRMARAAGLGARLEDISVPDREITVEILGVFGDYADFTTWLAGTVHRRVARKATSSTWGLYLADARNQADDVSRKRKVHENEVRDWNIRQEEQRAAEAEEQRKMDTPMPALEAFFCIQRRVPTLPRPLKARLVRTGELISPNELEGQVRAWKRCGDCNDVGTTGNAIDRTFAFCACGAGIEAGFRDGADWCEREMARVHADTKSVLVAACRALDRQFTADGIEASEVDDDGINVRITPPTKVHAICIADGDVEAALQRIGWSRAVRVVWAGRPATRAQRRAAK